MTPPSLHPLTRALRHALRARPAAAQAAPRPATARRLLPLGALAAGFGLAGFGLPAAAQAEAPTELAQAEPPPAAPARPVAAADPPRMPAVQVRAESEGPPPSKASYQAITTTAGKGQQELRDIPQSVTVIPEKLMDDRNLDTLKGALHGAVGIAFEAGEGGAIGDLIRLRGFATRGDIFLDGMRDIAQYNRDTFNLDRIELLRGSASMLYGRGSTGGIINQASKQPFGLTQHEADLTIGTDDYRRVTGDFNWRLGENAALRLNVMKTDADSTRNGPETHREGFAPTLRWGIGQRNEFSVGAYHLSYDDVPDYGFRWLNGRPVDAAAERWYGSESDYQKDSANSVFFTWLHRLEGGGEIRTSFRDGRYKRDLWATTAGLSGVANEDAITDASTINRGNQTRAAKDRHRFLQTDYSGRANWFGLKHELLAGAEIAHEDTTTFAYTGTPAKGSITWADTGGTPAVVDTRVKVRNTAFRANTVGLYAQDTVQIAPHWKLMLGARHDRFSADYERRTGGPLDRKDAMWSHREGLLWQPDAMSSYYISHGTSFNASGDLYQFDDRSANTAPEKSRNIEIGAKWDLREGNLSLRTALFRTEKFNERNTDVDQAADAYLLNGKRHTDGIEFELAGRPHPAVEVFGGIAYMRGKIDEAGSSASSQATVGKDSGLTPRWTGNIFVTWAFAPKWRLGLGADGMSDRVPAQAEAGSNRAPGYVKADALLEYDAGPWRTKLLISNLTDKVYADGLYRGFTVAGPTRSALLTLGLKF